MFKKMVVRGNCSFMTGRSGDGDPIGNIHVTMQEAKDTTRNGEKWCCSSCSTPNWIEMNGVYMMLN